MAKRFFSPPNEGISLKFREAPFELLTDFLVNLNTRNKDKLDGLSKCSGNFKDERLVEYIFMMTKELRLDPLTGYHAVELLQRFMVRHLTDMLTAPSPPAAAADPPRSLEDALFDKLKKKFPLIIFSCVQLASKLSLHSHIIDNNTAVRFLHSLGHSVSKQTLVESELMVLKGLEFRLNPPNPLTYVEILLEVLAHNRPSIPLEHLYHLCHYVLQFISLHRTAIFDSLLATTTQSVSPSREQREKFVTVTEDYMLLGVGVIAVASFILYGREWKQMLVGVFGGSSSSWVFFTLLTVYEHFLVHIWIMNLCRGTGDRICQ